jgi:uncharacterized OB-fold protein
MKKKETCENCGAVIRPPGHDVYDCRDYLMKTVKALKEVIVEQGHLHVYQANMIRWLRGSRPTREG